MPGFGGFLDGLCLWNGVMLAQIRKSPLITYVYLYIDLHVL